MLAIPLKKLLSVIEINQLQFCEIKLWELVDPFELFHFLSMLAQGYGRPNFEILGTQYALEE